MARRPADMLVSVACSPGELQILAELRAKGGFTSDANAIRSALWSLADHYEMDMQDGVFDQRHSQGYVWDKRTQSLKRRPTRTTKRISQRDPVTT